MVFKLNISDKGKAWRLQSESEFLVGTSVGDKIDGKEFGADFEGYEFEITGGSDVAGFPLSKDVEGLGLRKVLLSKGWGMKDSRKGMRLRKTVRGKIISDKVSQINIKVIKLGKKGLEQIFPDQNKVAEPEVKKEEEKVEAKA